MSDAGAHGGWRPAPRSFRHRMEYLLLRSLVFCLSAFPFPWTRWTGRRLGELAYLLRIRRSVTLENLAHAFPDWSEARRQAVARESYRGFGTTFLELARLPTLPVEAVRSLTAVLGDGPMREALEDGRGLVLCTGHLGNWELIGARMGVDGFPITVAVRTQRNRRVDAWVTRARESKGMRVLRVEEGAKRMLGALRRGGFLTLLLDQDAGRRGVFIDFLGRPASTAIGAVRFARLARCPIVAGYAIRQPDGRYVAEMEPPVHLREDLPPEEAEREALERLIRRLEERVREHPEQWFWMHRRWKTRP